jgi:hypothetical protein
MVDQSDHRFSFSIRVPAFQLRKNGVVSKHLTFVIW